MKKLARKILGKLKSSYLSDYIAIALLSLLFFFLFWFLISGSRSTESLKECNSNIAYRLSQASSNMQYICDQLNYVPNIAYILGFVDGNKMKIDYKTKEYRTVRQKGVANLYINSKSNMNNIFEFFDKYYIECQPVVREKIEFFFSNNFVVPPRK